MEPVVQVAMPKRDQMQTADFLAEQDPAGRRLIVRHPHVWRPPTDLYETEGAYIACIEVAGMKGGQLSVSIADTVLTVTGVRQNASPRGAYHQLEIQYGEFRTQVRVPTSVDEEKIEAAYADGFLTVVMPKRGTHHVKVNPADTPLED